MDERRERMCVSYFRSSLSYHLSVTIVSLSFCISAAFSSRRSTVHTDRSAYNLRVSRTVELSLIKHRRFNDRQNRELTVIKLRRVRCVFRTRKIDNYTVVHRRVFIFSIDRETELSFL